MRKSGPVLMLVLVLLFCGTFSASAQELSVTGLAGAGVVAADIERARRFYSGALGLAEAFNLKNERGRVVSSFFKVNDEQYVQVIAGEPGTDIRLAYIAFATPDVQGLRKALLKRGVIPRLPAKTPEGDLAFSMLDPDGMRVDFVQRQPDSLQAKSKGKYLNESRLSRRLWHAGILTANLDASLSFYRDKLAFSEFWRGGPRDGELRWVNMKAPGPGDDYIELMLYSEPLTREQYGTMQHLSFQVPSAKATVERLIEIEYPGAERLQPRVGRNGRIAVNLTDPDGTRIELMEPKVVK